MATVAAKVPQAHRVLGKATWRAAEFLGLRGSELAEVIGVIDLTADPWRPNETLWMGDDYEPCQVLAESAHDNAIDVIRYWSARRVEGRCCAVLAVRAITEVDTPLMQTWHRQVTRQSAFMIHSGSGRSISVEFLGGP